jgi:hypothetical protein
VQIYANAGGKRPIHVCQPLLVLYKQHANQLLSLHNYTPLVISGNDKHKQLTAGAAWLTYRVRRGSRTGCGMAHGQGAAWLTDRVRRGSRTGCRVAHGQGAAWLTDRAGCMAHGQGAAWLTDRVRHG